MIYLIPGQAKYRLTDRRVYSTCHTMLRPRIILPHGGQYHCISRIVDKRFIFGKLEMVYFHSAMRKLEAFLGIHVLSYCLMSNHFHLLVEVSNPECIEKLKVDSLRQKLPLLYHGKALALLRDEIDRAEASAISSGVSTWLDEILARYQARMSDLSVFLKELKQRFTQWYNLCNERSGTLWEQRFTSIVVDGADEHAVMTMAAYIELNPVRAGLVKDPMHYRWCSYAEAVAGKKAARAGLIRLHARTRAWQGRASRWKDVADAYRVHLFGKGERQLGDPRTGTGVRGGIAPNRVDQVVDGDGGKLTLRERLLHRARYFCDGVAFGSPEFVDNVFASHRDQFGAKRKTGARKMRGDGWGGLATMRDLQKNVFDET